MLPQVFVNSLLFSVLLALMGLGLGIVYGVGRIMNWAHGELYMLAAVGIWLLGLRVGLPYYLAAIASIIAVIVVGLLIERIIYKPLRGLHLPSFIAAYGVLLALQGSIFLLLGGLDKIYPSVVSGSIALGGVTLSMQRVITIPLAVVGVLFCLWFMLRTKSGLAIRAMTQDAGAARLHGMSVDTLCSIAMGLGTVLAAYTGVLAAPLFTIQPFMGSSIMWNAWMAVIIGGRTNLGGIIYSSIILGFMTSFITTYIDGQTAVIITALFLAVVLAVKPMGLWRGAEA